MSQAGNETKLNWIAARRNDDWNGRSCRLGGLGRARAASRDDDGYLTADQITHQRGQPIALIVAPAIFDTDVLALEM